MEVKLPTEGTRYVQALLLTATAYLQYRAHFLPAVAAYRGYGRPAVPKVLVQALRACLGPSHRSRYSTFTFCGLEFYIDL